MSTADVTKAANGDVTAFERLVVEHLQVVHAITLRYAGSLQE